MALIGRIIDGIKDPKSAIDFGLETGKRAALGKLPYGLDALTGGRPWPYPKQGYIVRYEQPRDFIQFHMNPSEYTEKYGAKYPDQEVPGRDNPLLQYSSGDKHTIEFSLFLDDWFPKFPVQKSCEEAIQWLYGTLVPEIPAGKKLGKAPPLLSLIWGNITDGKFKKYGFDMARSTIGDKAGTLLDGLFGKSKRLSTKGKFVLESIVIKRQFLDKEGRARRAIVDIVLLEYKEASY